MSTPGSMKTMEGKSLSSECGRIDGVDVSCIVSELGAGEPMAEALRDAMEAAFGTGFPRVSLHHDARANVLCEHFGVEAFAMGDRLAFRRGRFQPESETGRQLLSHELAHVVEARNAEVALRCWFTSLNMGIHPYKTSLQDTQQRALVVSSHSNNTHEALTGASLASFGFFGPRALEVILHWNVNVDNYKGGRFRDLVNTIFSSGSPTRDFVEEVLHSWEGTASERIGLTNTLDAHLTNGGLTARLRDEAAQNYNGGHRDHALRLLGISLHMVQDFFSHHVPLTERFSATQTRNTFPLRSPNWNVWDEYIHILEDDPVLDPGRFQHARERTRDQLYNFWRRLDRASQERIRTESRPDPPPMTLLPGGVPDGGGVEFPD